jgi:hypothetical protein
MAQNVITTSIVVEFGSVDGAEGILSLEVDDRPGGLNGGNTSFIPGDTVYLLRYNTTNVGDLVQSVSGGSLAKDSTGSYVVTEEYLTFANEREANLAKPYGGGFSYKWLGTDLGVPTISDEMKVSVPTKGVGVMKVSYTTNYTAFRLSSPLTLNGETVFKILVYMAGTAYPF